MLADSKFIKEVIGKEVENRGKYRISRFIYFIFLDFELYTHVEHNRTLVHAQASAILSFIQGNDLVIVNDD
jgi:hypothetical protein